MTNRSDRRGEQAAIAHDIKMSVPLIGHPSREHFIMARSHKSAPLKRPKIWLQSNRFVAQQFVFSTQAPGNFMQ